jgi:eukaryotic-like serine/threonine-protein kinase
VPGRACPTHGGATAPELTAPATPPAWSRPLGRCIGSGGFASVWEIAGGGVLKVAHVDHDQARARMAREAEALAAIGRPTVPQLFERGVLADGRAWIAMERIAGDNLADLVCAGPLRTDRAVALALGILDALDAVHRARFVHRDLKPDNLVLRDDRTIAVLDFGLARRLPSDPDDPTRAHVQVGSLEYIPPEQLLDATAVDERADLYAFGCILYELCAGRPPFLGDSAALQRAHAALRPPPLGALVAVQGELETLVHDCLAKLPARRPESARALRTAFAQLRETTPPSARTQRAEHTWSVIGEGTQPVVLLWAELPRVDRALVATLAGHRATIVSQRGRRILAALTGIEHADPAAMAIETARELAAAGARVVLHLDELRVTHDVSGLVLAGAAIERPEGWLPPGSWTGVVLTRALAAVTLVPARPSELGPGYIELGDPGEVPELFGRDALLADLAADAAAALAGLGPGLALLVGDAGTGKSAFAAALGPRLFEIGAHVTRGAVPPPGSIRPGYTALGELIASPPSGPLVRSIGDALRAAARAHPTAIVLDDLHLAEPELLDALEYATLGGEPLPLWILGIASPRLELRRPGFGGRAERFRRDTLAPLGEDAAVDLIAAALRPAEYPPLRALRQIAAIARGNALHLRALTREIHDLGAIRPRANGEHFLDTTVLDALPPIALGPWLAARELAELGGELVGLARLCSVLGEQLARDELAAVVALVERRGGATTSIDVDVGLRELAAAGILVATSATWAFRQPLVLDGIYATTDVAHRRDFHLAALDYWLTRRRDDPAVAERIARHAEAVEDRRHAAQAFATLGAHAHEQHRSLDADRAWQGALRNLPERTTDRARALLGRARARYRFQRIRDALVDLDEAVTITRELGDEMLELETLLEKATALEWSDEFASARQLTEQVHQRLAVLSDPPQHLVHGVALARGRSLFRENQLAQALPLLQSVFDAGVREPRTIAGLLLGTLLIDTDDLDGAERVLGTIIGDCQLANDRFHLAAAYNNRAFLWSARDQLDRLTEDLRIVIELAREIGQANIERAAAHNLAETELWQGHVDEALRLARRCLSIAENVGEQNTSVDRILLARIWAARGDRAALAAALGSIAGTGELTDHDQRILDVLRAMSSQADAATWDRALTGARELPASHRAEMERIAAANEIMIAR